MFLNELQEPFNVVYAECNLGKKNKGRKEGERKEKKKSVTLTW